VFAVFLIGCAAPMPRKPSPLDFLRPGETGMDINRSGEATFTCGDELIATLSTGSQPLVEVFWKGHGELAVMKGPGKVGSESLFPKLWLEGDRLELSYEPEGGSLASLDPWTIYWTKDGVTYITSSDGHSVDGAKVTVFKPDSSTGDVTLEWDSAKNG